MTGRRKCQFSSYGSLLVLLLLAATSASAGTVVTSGAGDLSVDSVGTTHLAFFDAAGSLVLAVLGPSGETTFSKPYGPYPGWTPRATAQGDDGSTVILWSHDDGAASIWQADGLVVRMAFPYAGPAGWTAIDVAAAAGSRSHVLSTSSDGTVSLLTIEDGYPMTVVSFGPYPGWTATAIADGRNGLTRLLWNNADGRSAVSLVSLRGIIATDRYESVAGWTSRDIAVGEDGLTRILRAHEDGHASLWIADEAGQILEHGPIYGASAELAARRVAAGQDGSSRILFTNGRGAANLWWISREGVYEGAVSLKVPATTPSADDVVGTWTGTFISADFVDCEGDATYAQASFELVGSTVIGVLDAHQNECGFGNVAFRGTVRGNVLSGTITGDRFSPGSAASGTLSGDTLEIVVTNSFGYIPGGTMHLGR